MDRSPAPPGWARLPAGDERHPLAVALALRLAAAASRAEVAQAWGEALQALVGWRRLELQLDVPQTGRSLPLLKLGGATPGQPAPRRTAATSIELSLPLARGAGIVTLQMERDAMYTGSERALVEDICEHGRLAMSRADAQERLAEAYRRIVVFGRLALRLGEQTSAVEAGQLIADIADELIGWDACYFDLYDAGSDTIREMINIDTIGGVKKLVPGHHTSGPPGRLERRMLDEGGFVLEQDVHAPSEYRLFGDESRPSAAMLFVPARHRSEVVAFFSIQSYTPHAYTRDDLELLQTLADHCAGALARIRLEERLLAREPSAPVA